MNSNSISNVSNILGIAGGELNISNTDHFITLPAPGITYATGGTITQSGGRTFHTFTSSGTFDLLVSVGTVEVMGIGGGGGGGGLSGGGGGAGNLVVVTSTLAVDDYTITVGGGGAGGTTSVGGSAGAQSRFTNGSTINIRMLGGGGGSSEGYVAGNGGCGGGGSAGTESLVYLYRQDQKNTGLTAAQRARKATLEGRNLRFFAAFLCEYCNGESL
jgi:hypothetical protein